MEVEEEIEICEVNDAVDIKSSIIAIVELSFDISNDKAVEYTVKDWFALNVYHR